MISGIDSLRVLVLANTHTHSGPTQAAKVVKASLDVFQLPVGWVLFFESITPEAGMAGMLPFFHLLVLCNRFREIRARMFSFRQTC